MNLQTPRLFLRPVRPGDAADLFVARGDAQAMRYWDWPPQQSAEEVRRIIAAHDAEIDAGTTLWWVAAETPRGKAIGECDLSEIDLHHRRAEVGYLFRRAVWGKGYAFEAMARILRYGAEELGIERFTARLHDGNEASRRLIERLGFAYEGRLRGFVRRDGARRDCLLYGRQGASS